MPKQFNLIPKQSDRFGGSLLKGNNPKQRRPVSNKFPMHLVLKAHRSCLRLPKTYGKTSQILREVCQRHHVTLYKSANVGNHIHAVIKLHSVPSWRAFIRELSGRLAMMVAETNDKLKQLVKDTGLWSMRPFTAIVRNWGKGFESLKRYVAMNEWEIRGEERIVDRAILEDLRAVFGIT